MNSEPDYYAILQVDPRAETDIITAAYKKLAAKYHPDVDHSPKAVERMKMLNAAYEVLSNPEKRKAYNLSRGVKQPWNSQAEIASGRQRPWWVLPLMIIIILGAIRLHPRLIIIAVPIVLVLWFIWGRSKSNSS